MLLKFCVLLTLFVLILPPDDAFAQSNRVDVAKSIVNVSRLNGGGSFTPGDTLEIRVTVAVLTISTRTIIDLAQVRDTVPANTSYINGSLSITTNEGIIYKGPFTEDIDMDQGSMTGGNIVINLGTGADGTNGGRIRSDSSRPRFSGYTCIMVARYRVRIDPSVPTGAVITIGNGSFHYRQLSPTPASLHEVHFPSYEIILSEQTIACDNGTDVSAAGDHMGTFGNGDIQNRLAPLAFTTTYNKVDVSSNTPNDYYYAIVNNSSPTGNTDMHLGVPNSNKVFTFWDIIGDHTGAPDPIMGNPPVAPGEDGGYMVLVNASYKTDTAYRETLTGLCPNTYYKFSAWVRNICPRCSSDSLGRTTKNAGFIPGPGNDSSGVKPNISFEIDGLIYYTSGDIPYSRTTPWKQYGFTFRTGPTQTTAEFLIRNNSPGGGGNDWALDDITIAHCGPNLNMNYEPIALGCSANPFYVSLSDTVRYVYADSYIHYKWQKSNIGGTVWYDITTPGATGVGTPDFVDGMYQYVTNLPPFLATHADSGTYYRLIVATSSENLHNDCAYTDGSVRLVSVIDCGSVLSAKFTRFHGEIIDNKASLKWMITDETDIEGYIIEKSVDGIHFDEIGQLDAINHQPAHYTHNDPIPLIAKTFYRIKMYNRSQLYKYSNIIALGSEETFQLIALENPVNGPLRAQVYVPEDGVVEWTIFDSKGQKVFGKKLNMQTGINNILSDESVYIPKGIYILQIRNGKESITKRIIKL